MNKENSSLLSDEKVIHKDKFKRKSKISRALFIFFMLIVPVIQFLIFYVYLNISSFMMAFKSKNVFENREYWVGLSNFAKVGDELWRNGAQGPLLQAIKNSLIYFFFNELVMMPLMVLLAYFFWKRMPGYKVFRLTFLLPQMLPGVVMPMLFAFMLDSSFGILNPLMKVLGLGQYIPKNGWLGQYNTAQTMIILYIFWSGVGLSVMMFTGNLNRMPAEIFESARLDGITLFKELWYLVIPMIMPLLSIMIVTGTATVFNIYLPPMIITKGGPAGSTRTIMYIIMEWTTQGNEYLGAAGGLCFSCISIPLTLLLKWGLGKLTTQVEY